MAKKEILTNDKIEKDIITAIKKPPNDSERTYKRTTYLVAIIAATIIVVTAFISPDLLIWEFLAFLTLPFVYVIFFCCNFVVKWCPNYCECFFNCVCFAIYGIFNIFDFYGICRTDNKS